MRTIKAATIAFIIFAVPLRATASCGSAACSLNTSWDSQGVWTEPGLRLDLRFEYLDQDTLRDGHNEKTEPGAPGTHDESRTINRNYLLTLDYVWSPKWGATLQLPYYNRSHMNRDYPETVATVSAGRSVSTDSGKVRPAGHTVEVGPDGREQIWRYNGIGDLSAWARYQAGMSSKGAWGLNFGAKFPTAPRKIKANDGLDVDRAVNPGTGSWDLLLGIYGNRQFSAVSSGFASLNLKTPVIDDGEYRPGTVASLDMGYRRMLSAHWSFIPQLNTQFQGREGGSEGLPDNSGGVYVNLSPGLSYLIGDSVQLFTFVQIPVYRYLSGPQVLPDWSVALGLSVRN